MNALLLDFLNKTHLFGFSKTPDSFESKISKLKKLTSEYTSVIITSRLSKALEIKMFNHEGKTLFSKSTTVNRNRETKAIAILIRDIANGLYTTEVFNQLESMSLSFQK